MISGRPEDLPVLNHNLFSGSISIFVFVLGMFDLLNLKIKPQTQTWEIGDVGAVEKVT